MTTTTEAPKPFKDWYADLDVNQISEIITGGEYTERMAEAYNTYVVSFLTKGTWDYNNGHSDGYFKGIADASGVALAVRFKEMNEEINRLKQQLKTTEK